MKIGLFVQEINFIKEFPGSNFFLLPSFLTGGKWDFQAANLLLATVNFEPCITIGARKIDGMPCISAAELLEAIAGPECHFSHPLDKNIPFYRCLRFFLSRPAISA